MNISERTKELWIAGGLTGASLLFGGLALHTEVERPEITMASTTLNTEEVGVQQAQMYMTAGAFGFAAFSAVQLATLSPPQKKQSRDGENCQ